jgi:hypothetical protein
MRMSSVDSIQGALVGHSMAWHILNADDLSARLTASALRALDVVLKMASGEEPSVAIENVSVTVHIYPVESKNSPRLPLLTFTPTNKGTVVEVASDMVQSPLKPLEADRMATTRMVFIAKQAPPLASLHLFQEHRVDALPLRTHPHRQRIRGTNVIRLHNVVG